MNIPLNLSPITKVYAETTGFWLFVSQGCSSDKNLDRAKEQDWEPEPDPLIFR